MTHENKTKRINLRSFSPMTKEQLLALNLTEDQVTAIIEDYGKNYVSKSQFNKRY